MHRGRAPSHFWAKIGQLLLQWRRMDDTFFLFLDDSGKQKEDG